MRLKVSSAKWSPCLGLNVLSFLWQIQHDSIWDMAFVGAWGSGSEGLLSKGSIRTSDSDRKGWSCQGNQSGWIKIKTRDRRDGGEIDRRGWGSYHSSCCGYWWWVVAGGKRKYWYVLYPIKYAHRFCFALFCCGYVIGYWEIHIRFIEVPIFFRVASLVLRLRYYCFRAIVRLPQCQWANFEGYAFNPIVA